MLLTSRPPLFCDSRVFVVRDWSRFDFWIFSGRDWSGCGGLGNAERRRLVGRCRRTDFPGLTWTQLRGRVVGRLLCLLCRFRLTLRWEDGLLFFLLLPSTCWVGSLGRGTTSMPVPPVRRSTSPQNPRWNNNKIWVINKRYK